MRDILELAMNHREQLSDILSVSQEESSEGELAAMVSFAIAFPDGFMALVDTYDVKRYSAYRQNSLGYPNTKNILLQKNGIEKRTNDHTNKPKKNSIVSASTKTDFISNGKLKCSTRDKLTTNQPKRQHINRLPSQPQKPNKRSIFSVDKLIRPNESEMIDLDRTILDSFCKHNNNNENCNNELDLLNRVECKFCNLKANGGILNGDCLLDDNDGVKVNGGVSDSSSTSTSSSNYIKTSVLSSYRDDGVQDDNLDASHLPNSVGKSFR